MRVCLQSLVGQILNTLEQVLPQGVEIQLKILQTLVSLLTTKVGGGGGGNGRQPLVRGEELGQVKSTTLCVSPSTMVLIPRMY